MKRLIGTVLLSLITSVGVCVAEDLSVIFEQIQTDQATAKIGGNTLDHDTVGYVEAFAFHPPMNKAAGNQTWLLNDPNVLIFLNNLRPNELYQAVYAERTDSGSKIGTTTTAQHSFNTQPTNLQAHSNPFTPGNTSITLRWIDPSNPSWTTYDIKYSRNGAAITTLSSVTAQISGTIRTYTITGLAPGDILSNISVTAVNFSRDNPDTNIDGKTQNSLPFNYTGQTTGTINKNVTAGPVTIGSLQSDNKTLTVSIPVPTCSDNNAAAVCSNITYSWSVSDPTAATFDDATTRNPVVTFLKTSVPVTFIVTVGATVTGTDVTNQATSTSYTLRAIPTGPFTITSSPTPPPFAIGNSVTFTAVGVKDQLGGSLSNVPLDWALTKNSVNGNVTPLSGNGVSFIINTGNQTNSDYTLNASSDSATATPFIFHVAGNAPTVQINSFTIFTTTGIFHAHGDDLDNGQAASLTYHWFVDQKPAGASDPTFTPNDYMTEQDVVALFRAASSTTQYRVKVTVTDADGLSGTAEQLVTVQPVIQGLVVCAQQYSVNCANEVSVKKLVNLPLVATLIDQFSAPAPTNSVTWSGSSFVNGAGVFNSPTAVDRIRITAVEPGGKSGSIFINAVDLDVSAAKAYPVPWKSTEDTVVTFTGLGTSSKIRIYTTAGRLVWERQHTGTGDETWPVVNSDNKRVASGVYLYVVESPEGTKKGKIIIIQ